MELIQDLWIMGKTLTDTFHSLVARKPTVAALVLIIQQQFIRKVTCIFQA
jgi:hypothetical protein